MLQAPPTKPKPWNPSTTTRVFMVIGGITLIGLIWWAGGEHRN